MDQYSSPGDDWQWSFWWILAQFTTYGDTDCARINKTLYKLVAGAG